MEKLAKLLNKKKDLKILDVGTGSGNFIGLIKSLYTYYEEIIGIDTLQRAITSAESNFSDDEKVSFQVMNANKMTFQDDYFDVVCLSNSLHHLDEPKIILDEMARVLKPGGFILIAEMINNDLDERQMSHKKLHHFAAKIDRISGEVHNDTFSDKKIIDVLNAESSLAVSSTWKLKYERRKENTDEEIEWLIDTIDRVMKRVPEEKIEVFTREANEIKDYINKHGFDSCTTLIAVMRK